MKKLIPLILFVFTSAHIFAQQQEAQSDTAKYMYCQIVGTGRYMSNKVTIDIDFGQFRSFWETNKLKDPQTGKNIVFNSMIDALNYMGNNGWEFVQAYAITMGGNQNVYHYLLKKPKKIIEEEDKQELKK